jgi:hypothetical protein
MLRRSLNESSRDQPMTGRNLGPQNFPYQLTGLFHFRDRQRAINLFAVASACQHPSGFQNGEVLRKTRLGNTQRFLQLRNSSFTLAQKVKNLKTSRVGKRFADARQSLVDFCISVYWCFSGCHNFDLLQLAFVLDLAFELTRLTTASSCTANHGPLRQP